MFNSCQNKKLTLIYEQKLYPVTILDIKDTVHNNFILTCKTNYDTIVILSHDNHTDKGVDVLEIGKTVILKLESWFPIIAYDTNVTIECATNYCGFEFMPWSFGNKQLYLSKDLDGLNVKKDYSRYYKVDVALTERTDTLLQKLQTPNEKKDNNDRNP